MAEIEIRNLSKSFDNHKVLDDISLKIEKGDIYGVLGLSGAGKSTLVRCINGLETFDEGEILYRGETLCSPNEKISRANQRKIAMIFQSFNLLQQRTVLKNVQLPLELDSSLIEERKQFLLQQQKEELSNVSDKSAKKELEKKYKEKIKNIKKDLALEALEKVGLLDKANQYPSQLSGGQCQRVAIARALVLKPEVILSDEATSALDPETTLSILDLLKDLNKSLGLTIIMISHQMNAIEYICNKVAIISKAKIIEEGNISDVFLAPKADISKSLIYANHVHTKLSNHRLVRILFDGDVDEPLLSNVVQDCQIIVSIVYADTKVVDNKAYGQTIIKRPKDEKDAQKLFKYLSLKGVKYEEVEQ